MQYGRKLWRQIWKVQLGLASPDQFWKCLATRRPVVRQVASRSPAEKGRIPAGLVISLTKVVGLDEREVLSLTRAEAEARWQEFLRGLSAESNPDQG